MKIKGLLIVLAIISTALLIGCETPYGSANFSAEDVNKVIQCQENYMRHGSSCCLDKNNNKICDNDENKDKSKICKYVDVPYEEKVQYTEKEPYEVKECHNEQDTKIETVTKTNNLFDVSNKVIENKDRLGYGVNLNAGELVHLKFSADDTLYLWVVTKSDWDNTVGNPLKNAGAIYIKEDVKGADVSFTVPSKDDYVIYLKNNHLWEDVSVYGFSSWYESESQEEKTTTKEVCEMVVKYKDVTKTKTEVKYKKEEHCV